MAKVIDSCRAAELSQAQMREVDGNPNPTESVNMVRITKRGATKISQRASGNQNWLVCVISVEMLMSLKKNALLHMARGAICGKDNHFVRMCQKKSSQQKKVNTVEESSEDEVYILNEVSLVQSGADQFVKLRLQKSGNFMKFLLDTGAECNVVPLKLYKEATGDFLLQNVIPCNDVIVAFGGPKMRLAGRVLLPVSRGDTRCTLCCNLVDAEVCPVLGWKACVGMKPIQVLGSDDVSRPNTDGHSVFAMGQHMKPLTKKRLEEQFPTVFADGIGKLDVEHHIHLDPSVDPMQRAPRWMQVALKPSYGRHLRISSLRQTSSSF